MASVCCFCVNVIICDVEVNVDKDLNFQHEDKSSCFYFYNLDSFENRYHIRNCIFKCK